MDEQRGAEYSPLTKSAVLPGHWCHLLVNHETPGAAYGRHQDEKEHESPLIGTNHDAERGAELVLISGD